VDKDRFVREACREAAQSLGYLGRATDSTDQAFWLVESENIDVVFLAACGDFISVIQRLKEKRPAIEVIAMTNSGTLRFAVDVMKAGAYDVIAKPFGLAEVKRLLQDVGSHLRTKTESRLECEKHRSARGFGNMIGLPDAVTQANKTCANERRNAVMPIAELEREAILGAIAQLNGDKLTAAKLLGIGKTTLYRKLKEYEGLQ
jgi:DNA-binding NtrC family response regulator